MNPVLCLICQNPEVHLNPDWTLGDHFDHREEVISSLGMTYTTGQFKPQVRFCPGSSTQHYVAEGDEFHRENKRTKYIGRVPFTLHDLRNYEKGPRDPDDRFRLLRSNDLCALRDGKLVRVEEQPLPESTETIADPRNWKLYPKELDERTLTKSLLVAKAARADGLAVALAEELEKSNKQAEDFQSRINAMSNQVTDALISRDAAQAEVTRLKEERNYHAENAEALRGVVAALEQDLLALRASTVPREEHDSAKERLRLIYNECIECRHGPSTADLLTWINETADLTKPLSATPTEPARSKRMKDAAFNYWRESLGEILSEMGVYDLVTKEQLDAGAASLETSHDCYGMAFGHDCIPNPLASELRDAKEKLEKERAKVVCPECMGRGRLINHGPCHSSDSQCWNCNGEGYRKP